MKNLLKGTRNKRKSVNEKAAASSSSKSGSTISKSTSRSGSRLGSSRSLLDSRNKSTESDINSMVDPSIPSFARNSGSSQHPYSNLKNKHQRDSKASSSFMEPPGRKSLESQAYDEASEYSQNAGFVEVDQNSIISHEEPINKFTSPVAHSSNKTVAYASSVSPVHNIDEESSAEVEALSSTFEKTDIDNTGAHSEKNPTQSIDITAPNAPALTNRGRSASSSSSVSRSGLSNNDSNSSNLSSSATSAKANAGAPASQYFLPTPKLVSNSASQYLLPTPKNIGTQKQQLQAPKTPQSPSRMTRKLSIESAKQLAQQQHVYQFPQSQSQKQQHEQQQPQQQYERDQSPQQLEQRELLPPLSKQRTEQTQEVDQQYLSSKEHDLKATYSNSNREDAFTLVSSNASISTGPRPIGNLSSSNYDQTVFKTGWLNKGSNMTSWSSSITSDTWKLYRAELKGANLYLYKPPNDLGIKHFEPEFSNSKDSFTGSSNNTSLSPVPTITEETTRLSSAEPSGHVIEISSPTGFESNDNQGHVSVTKSTLSNSWSTATLSNNLANGGGRQPGGFPSPQQISYVSEVYPHPDLQFDEFETISNGSLEAVCHAVLFNTTEDNRLSSQLISVIPLFGDTKTSIGYFVQYAIIFMSVASSAKFKDKVHSFKFPLAPTLINKKPIIINDTTDRIITNRLALVVSVIQEQFPGMVMDQVIFEQLLKLLELIGVHNEALAKDLTEKVILQQQKMTELLVFDGSTASRGYKEDEMRLSADQFLKMNLEELSNQINLIDLKFNKEWNPKTDASLLYETGYSYSRYNPLIFDPVSNIHYLGRLLSEHLFENEDSKRSNLYRAKIIQKWVELGSIFDKKGDMVSWLAIATVVCSIPVLRLKKTWSVVDQKTLKTVSSEWGQVVFELDRRNMTSDTAHKSSYHVIAPQGIGESYSKHKVVPYFGDLAVKWTSNITLKQCEKRVQRVKISFNRWDEYLAVVPESKDFGEIQNPVPKVQRLLYNLLSIHVSLPRLKQEDLMKLSLAIEPATSSSLFQFYASFDIDKPSISAGYYFPILFTNLLSNYRLFEKELLIEAGSPKAKNVRKNMLDDVHKSKSVTGVDFLDGAVITQHSKLNKNGLLAESIYDLLNIDADVFHVGDDLIFKAVALTDPASNAELSGEPIDSQKPLTVKVVAKASSLEKLIDILVLTPHIFSPHISEEDIKRYLSNNDIVGRSIKLDMDIAVYTETFFASYKSFCNLTTLIKGFGRRFVGAKSAAVSIKKMKENKELADNSKSFPDWNSTVDVQDPEINWKYVAQIEAGILEALYALISDFYADFTDDIQSKQCFVDILKIIDQEVVNEWKSILKQHSNGQDELFELYENIQLIYKKIRKFFIKRSYRPLDSYSVPHPFKATIDFPPDNVYIPGSSQFIEIQQFTERLDIFIFDQFRQITVTDWMVVSDLLEMQSTKSLTGIFSYKQPSPAISEEDLKIFNVFAWLDSLYVESPDVKLSTKFPPNVRALYALHSKITCFILNQIIEPRLAMEKRRNRMRSILQMLAIVRCRMNSANIFTGPSNRLVGRVPSFLESCISMAVCAPESRWFVNDWIHSSVKLQPKERVSKWDTLEGLIPDISPNILMKDFKTPLTPCIGWFAERLLEVGCYIPNVSVENPLLLNFDKRRYVYKLITNIMALKSSELGYSNEEIEIIRKTYEFLYEIKKSVYDLRDIREAARKENKDYSRIEQKNKLFQELVEQEFEKLKRDVKKKESLDLQEKSRKKRTLTISKPGNVAKDQLGKSSANNGEITSAGGNINGSPNNLTTHSSNNSFSSTVNSNSSSSNRSGGRFRIGGFLKSVRPFSINVSSSWSAPERVASTQELPDPKSVTDRCKPVLQYKVFSCKPLIIHSSDIEGFFKFIDIDAQEHCFQALNNNDASDWVKAINEAKRYSYLSREARERHGTKVFGVPIQLVCEREGKVVPYVVEKLLNEIESRGLNEVGLYRVPGAVANIQSLKQKFDESVEVSLEDHRWLEVNTLAGCFKLYLRELPESILTSEMLPSFVAVTQSENVTESLADLIKQLPFYNYHLLKRLVFHLNQVTEHSAKNRMDAANLAMIFSMSFLSASENDVTMSLGSLQSILLLMIQKPQNFFTNAEYDKAAAVYTTE